ncbi:MAG TPA: bifunctional hydroxymethylpyrimidine kinase/phosphomethylpyrimidine kinase [Dehalococcoidia bacterium]|nr:bifunctional hydroxymethylpyrimidine kinase/phosphomethylpyrimidine kinase [Dehalococcoidia bacterium]
MPAVQEQAPRALTIAGSDSGGGAGIQADLKTFAALGVYGASAVTAVTAQDTTGVRAWQAVDPALVGQQIDAVLEDIGAGAAKTGMLASAAIVRAVADRLRAHGVSALVVDPVMVATSGDPLLDEDARAVLVRELLPLAAVATPNRAEAEVLAGRRIESWEDARAAARTIVELGARAVVITGGDFDDAESSTDLWFDGHAFREFTAVRVRTSSTHGTGCTFSAAIAAGLARGMGAESAVALAKSYVTLALQYAFPVGHGRGPVHHFYRYWQPVGQKFVARARPRAATEAE